jgi:hypothetical protein
MIMQIESSVLRCTVELFGILWLLLMLLGFHSPTFHIERHAQSAVVLQCSMPVPAQA